jgi:hypothetical protein
MPRINLERLMLRPFPVSPLRLHSMLKPLNSVSAIADQRLPELRHQAQLHDWQGATHQPMGA